MKQFIITSVAVVIGFFGTLFIGYIGIASVIWVFSDPFNLISDLEINDSNWSGCVYDTKRVFDDFNDTIGATYALEDLPSQGAREFMEFCLENRG